MVTYIHDLKIQEFIDKLKPLVTDGTISYERLRKRVRVFVSSRATNLKHIYCWIEMSTGDVYKGDWFKPHETGLRGNIADKDILSFMGPRGPHPLDKHGRPITQSLQELMTNAG